jgi:protein-S-isoprenylcysteine O-methyltransferase Ste14
MGPLIKTIVFSIVVPGTVTVYFPWAILKVYPSQQDWNIIRWAGIPPMATGLCFYLWCAYDFVFAGRGTPAPIDPPKELVVRGLYRSVRNPMYAGVIQVLVGEAFFFGSVALAGYLVIIFGMFTLFIRCYEEPILKNKFGGPYESYCRGVPRWIPHFRKLWSRAGTRE